jgi:hypothetical protein
MNFTYIISQDIFGLPLVKQIGLVGNKQKNMENYGYRGFSM